MPDPDYDYDRALQYAAQRHIIVSAILLVPKASSSSDPTVKLMAHPDADPAGVYAMPNVASPEGLQTYAAALNFLAERYSRPDKKYGRVHHWIMQNEVDAGWVWTNAGEKSELTFMDLYNKSMRTMYLIARQYNPHAKVFFSLTHYWNETEDTHFYLPRHMLSELVSYSHAEGDYEWAIAYHPYPESLFKPRTWEDKKVTFSIDTPFITFKNIEVLNAWAQEPGTFYRGVKRRTIYLSEQGFNSPDYSQKSLTDQAAALAYAWKKIEPLDAIEGMQYHNWVDSSGEGGLRIGLRKFPEDHDDPMGKKPIWYLYQKLGTPEEDMASAICSARDRHQGVERCAAFGFNPGRRLDAGGGPQSLQRYLGCNRCARPKAPWLCRSRSAKARAVCGNVLLSDAWLTRPTRSKGRHR